MHDAHHPRQHPQRVALHNEIHARPPEAMGAPLAISHLVMVCDAAEREASREHVAALLRDHHLPSPEQGCTHLRMDVGPFRIRWELHTEFVTWTFSRALQTEAFTERAPEPATRVVPQDWLVALPGQCLASMHLWVLPIDSFDGASLVKHVLQEDTLVASTVADGYGEVYTDFALHADGCSRMVLLAGGMTPRRLGRLVQRLLPNEEAPTAGARPQHLDPSALATPSLAISCAAREALHQADVVETMLLGVLNVIKDNDRKLAEDLRKMDDTVDELYSDIKYYLTKISREALGENEARRWTDIISFTINMEQIGDIIERVLIDIEDKKIKKGRQFSDAGMEEINELHARLVDNLRLAMSVFLNGNVRDAQKLLEEKVRFRDLEHAYSATHLARLSDNTVQSIETSSLHIDLISELKRINSLLCSVAYPILESAGALAPSRLRTSVL